MKIYFLRKVKQRVPMAADDFYKRNMTISATAERYYTIWPSPIHKIRNLGRLEIRVLLYFTNPSVLNIPNNDLNYTEFDFKNNFK